VSFNEVLNSEATVATSHFTGTPSNPALATLKAITDATDTVQDRNVNVEGIDQKPGNPQNTKFYAITAVCQETVPGGTQRELEFLLRVGL
jgi:hypothetical protein